MVGMLSLEDSRIRWRITNQHASTLEELKKSVRSDGNKSPCQAGLRSVCWKTFLLFQTTHVEGWARTLSDSRSAYTSLREHLLRFIHNPDELGSALDPLDDDRHSPWNTIRQDEEIRAEIFQDVERCMPEEPFFRKPAIQRVMLDILFIFCKINQDVGYRQGMHEILAPILWVVEHDATDFGKNGEQARNGSDRLLQQLVDPNYIEHDAFTILSLIMRTGKGFYELGEPDIRSSTPSGGFGSSQQGSSTIIERSKRIHEVYLLRVDPGLSKHITDIEVLPQIFVIRWVRLLFGREFPFEDLLQLWDVLFAEDPDLELVDMLCVAMLLRIRWQLIEANYSSALMLLLKYPAPSYPHGPKTFVDDAVYLRNNFTEGGGAHIIKKYSGKPPTINSPDIRPSTPGSQALSPIQRFSRTRSPLPSPARFLQQQGGVEALFQGAAKGVFDRGERLGINQAVRDAMGEVKKNMQGLQASRNSSYSSRRTSDVMRWSLDEGRPVTPSRTSVAAMSQRDQQLAKMLDQAMTDLRAVSTAKEGDKEMYVNAMEVAIAKVEFVKVYLEDSTMPLPAASEPSSPSSLTKHVHQKTTEPGIIQPSPTPAVLDPEAEVESKTNGAELGALPFSNTEIPPLKEPDIISSIKVDVSSAPSSSTTPSPDNKTSLLRPNAPVPSRSTIANSSFSWMLDTDDPQVPGGLGLKSSSPQSTSPFLTSSRKPTSGASREKAAFLFGEDGGESSTPTERDDAFDLKTMKPDKK